MSEQLTFPDWIAVDWGTSSLKVWAMGADGTVLAQNHSGQGTDDTAPDDFEVTLLTHIAPWLGRDHTPVIACGMVGAAHGWAQVPHRAVPCAPLGTPQTVTCRDARISMHILPGLKQERSADIMRGAETQIAGFLAQNPDYDGIICLPGIHTKWAHISAGEIVSFQTFMTGELFDLLSRASMLRHSIGEGGGIDQEAFTGAIADTISRPEAVATQLFKIRAVDVLHTAQTSVSRARLSGILLGLELAAARPYWLGQPVALMGPPAVTALYDKALSAQGVAPTHHDIDAATLQGLGLAYKTLSTG